VTAPRFRRHRSSDGRRPAFAGDFTDDGRDITEVLEAAGPPAWDGATMPLSGLRGQPRYTPAADPAEDYRQAIAQANAKPAVAPLARLRAQPHGPDMFPALPPGPPPAPAAGQHEPRDTGPQQRLPRYSRTAARPRPQRAPDCAIFIWSDLLGQHIMKCGVCLRSRYADPIAGTMPFTFEALRVSAHVSGWRTDAFSRWACPACQLTPAYWSPRQVIQWDGDAVEAYLAGDMRGREAPRYGIHPASDYPEFAEWYNRVGPEVAFRAAAELDLIDDVASGAGHGRHRAVTR
jgi:hypothetical protein